MYECYHVTDWQSGTTRIIFVSWEDKDEWLEARAEEALAGSVDIKLLASSVPYPTILKPQKKEK